MTENETSGGHCPDFVARGAEFVRAHRQIVDQSRVGKGPKTMPDDRARQPGWIGFVTTQAAAKLIRSGMQTYVRPALVHVGRSGQSALSRGHDRREQRTDVVLIPPRCDRSVLTPAC